MGGSDHGTVRSEYVYHSPLVPGPSVKPNGPTMAVPRMSSSSCVACTTKPASEASSPASADVPVALAPSTADTASPPSASSRGTRAEASLFPQAQTAIDAATDTRERHVPEFVVFIRPPGDGRTLAPVASVGPCVQSWAFTGAQLSLRRRPCARPDDPSSFDDDPPSGSSPQPRQRHVGGRIECDGAPTVRWKLYR